MNQQTLSKITDILLPCFNNGMKITDEALLDIIIDFEVTSPFSDGMKTIQEWFNSKDVYNMCDIDRERHIGLCLNVLSLLATGDIPTLIQNWVLSGAE